MDQGRVPTASSSASMSRNASSGGINSSNVSSSTSTVVNFSRPRRSDSMKSVKSILTRRRWSTQTESRDEQDNDDALPYRPVKAKFVQLHITSDDVPHTAPRPTWDQYRPPQPQPQAAVQQTAPRPSWDQYRQPAIPERTTSLQRKTRTWPPSWKEKREPSRSGTSGTFSFEAPPTLIRTPWEWERGRPNSRWSRDAKYANLQRKQVFAELPREIYQCIVDHLDSLHTFGQTVNVPALRNDLRSLCLVDKQWNRIAKEHLYRDIWLPSNKAPAKRKFSRQQKPSRLRQLLNTLRTSRELAFLVYRVRVTYELAEELENEVQASVMIKKDSSLSTLQEIIASCYNLEQFSGYILPASSITSDVFEALATRTRLKEHVWKLDSRYQLPNLMGFIHCHYGWLNLETLVLTADPEVDLGSVAVTAIVQRLPSLKHLMLSGLHESDVNDHTILSFPALKSLRFSNLRGLSDQGIEQLAYSRLASSLERLTLVDLELSHLETIQTVLSHLTRLRRFALVQDTSPDFFEDYKPNMSSPPLNSPNLRYLHWDCVMPGIAVSHLASAIANSRFPRLHTIKVPCDYDGIIQSLCRPIPRTRLTQEDLTYLAEHRKQQYHRDLRAAQIRAQIRIRESRQQPSFNVVVQDESMEVCDSHVIGSFLGNMTSPVEYSLEAEAGDRALAELEDVAKLWNNWRLETKVDANVLF